MADDENAIEPRDNVDDAQALLAGPPTSVKTFFHEAEAFEKIARDVLPSWFEVRDSQEPIRLWVLGCGNGAEAYSFAILLLEEAERHKFRRPPIQIFATDRDSRAVFAAREGRFPFDIAADVSQARLQRFFSSEGNHYRVRQEVREAVLFAVHDLLKDPPFSHVNLISCRSVPAHPDRKLQEQVCGIFYYALNPGGFLIVSDAEAVEDLAGLFRILDADARIYQSTAIDGGRPRQMPRVLAARVQEQVAELGRAMGPTLSEAAMHRRAIEQVAPPSILVDKSHRIVHLSESVGRYLLPSGGPLSAGAFDLVRPELRFELRSALHLAFDQNVQTLTLPVLASFDGVRRRVHMLIRPVRNDNFEPHSAVVMFIEGEAVDENAGPDEGQITDLVARLSRELELTEERLRAVREESSLSNEKLRATNEELQSMNEEYRSAFDEMEAGKELQWVNEELENVNSELKSKVEVISRAHSDLQNLVAAADFGALFLDSSLRIKRFTDRTKELFSIAPDDEGRLIADFTHQLEYDNLVRDAFAVLANLTPMQREVRSRQGRWYDMRVRPYRTTDGKIDGVVITFIDVTERHDIDDALRASEQHLRQVQTLVELSRDPIFIWDFDDGILAWNRGSEELYGYSRQEAIGKRKDQLLATEVPGSSFAELRAKLSADGSFNGEVRHRTKDGRELTIETLIVLETMHGKRLALESTRDVTERRQWEKQQQLLVGELAHRVRNTLAVVQAIAHQSLRTSKSGEDFVQGFDGRLSALASAHSLLVRTDWQGADLGTLAESQLDAYSDRVRVEGEPVLLPPNLATPFGLILHELATNAAKHGSLSRRGGTVDLTWNVDTANNARILTVVWREQGGPPVKQPTTTGLGSALIQNGIPSATVKREFNSAGLVCSIDLPLPNPGEIGTVEIV